MEHLHPVALLQAHQRVDFYFTEPFIALLSPLYEFFFKFLMTSYFLSESKRSIARKWLALDVQMQIVLTGENRLLGV